MAREIFGKLMMVIMDIVILILVKGKVTDLPSTLFHHSLTTLLPHLNKLDHEYSSLSTCLTLKELLRSCEEKLEVEHKFDFDCVIEKFRICRNMTHPNDPMYQKFNKVVEKCWAKHGMNPPAVGDCLYKWYKQHIKYI